MVTAFENASADYAERARQPLEPERCALLVVDIQEKLLPSIFQKDQLVRNSKLLIRAAGVLTIPAVMSTQYAKGLGKTVPEIASLLPETEAIDKDRVLLLRQRPFLCAAEAAARQPQHPAAVWNGKPHLRDADGAGGAARRLSRACRLGRGQLANGMELEDRPGKNARRRRCDLFHRDDDLRADALLVVARVQGDAAASEGIRKLAATTDCHPERSEGPWCLPAAVTRTVQARTNIPRFARDDK